MCGCVCVCVYLWVSFLLLFFLSSGVNSLKRDLFIPRFSDLRWWLHGVYHERHRRLHCKRMWRNQNPEKDSLITNPNVSLQTNFGSSFVEDNFCINDFTELLEKMKSRIWLHDQTMHYFEHRFEIIISKSKGNIRDMQTFLSGRWTIRWWWRTIGCNCTCWLRWMRWRGIRLTLNRQTFIYSEKIVLINRPVHWETTIAYWDWDSYCSLLVIRISWQFLLIDMSNPREVSMFYSL